MKPFPGEKWVARSSTGFRLEHSELAKRFPDSCGIYEMVIRKEGGSSIPVYVGSTCVSKPGKIHARIQKYCYDGDHKDYLIDRALKRGYEIWFRVKESLSKQEAQADENTLLDNYNYAWNIRRQRKDAPRYPVGY